MNKEIFAQMQGQLKPSVEAQDSLRERLGRAKGKRRSWGKYVAVAACAALLLGAYPAYRALKPARLHSYVAGPVAAAELTGQRESGTEDVGLTQGAGPAPNTGVIVGPTGAVEDAPVGSEEAVAAYQTLMARFQADYGEDRYPEWYGGSYLQGDSLIVNIVHRFDTVDKGFCLSIQDMAGSDCVGFGGAKYSYSHLRELQKQVDGKLGEMGLSFGSGIDEERGQLRLSLSEKSDEALKFLAEIDPEDDAIVVHVGEQTKTTDAANAPAVRHAIPEGKEPVKATNAPIAEEPTLVEPAGVEDLPATMPGGAVVSHEMPIPEGKEPVKATDDPIAEEPTLVEPAGVEDLPTTMPGGAVVGHEMPIPEGKEPIAEEPIAKEPILVEPAGVEDLPQDKEPLVATPEGGLSQVSAVPGSAE